MFLTKVHFRHLDSALFASKHVYPGIHSHVQGMLCEMTNTENKQELDDFCCQVHLLFQTQKQQDASLQYRERFPSAQTLKTAV